MMFFHQHKSLRLFLALVLSLLMVGAYIPTGAFAWQPGQDPVSGDILIDFSDFSSGDPLTGV